MVEFDSNGNLYPPQIIEVDFEAFCKIFVTDIKDSQTRELILTQYIEYLITLKKLIKAPFSQWINGSFVTKKLNPNDIDLVTFVDFNIYSEKEKEFDELRRKRQDRNSFLDGYFVKTYPKNHIHHHLYELDKVQWLFTFNRAKNSKLDKGFLQLNF